MFRPVSTLLLLLVVCSAIGKPFPEIPDLENVGENLTTPKSSDDSSEIFDAASVLDVPEETRSLPTQDDDWLFEDASAPKLKVERTVYSALLYQEDSFGLEFLCPGFWLRKDVVLIRRDCWANDVNMKTDGSVLHIFTNDEYPFKILHLKPKRWESEMVLHLANIEDIHMAMDMMSFENCLLFALREDCTLLERFLWHSRPVPFKREKSSCQDGHICLRTRVPPAGERDYALVCGDSLVGVQAPTQNGCDRSFGRLSLLDISLIKDWVDHVLQLPVEEPEHHCGSGEGEDYLLDRFPSSEALSSSEY
ncbi:uncharacterized protein LOC126569309 [Anopheles aquasalis]|uniref:uncharacterized protein LOC126569309 n=1 Tax=Anopheles aquasalis TaxID=42839 RepID=UPI00215B34EB|nr:uncharacterized protein LOC126569309 [Anopheles aquasalis]